VTLSSGTRLGPYDITSPLGSGGMGEVYRARDSRLGRDVALKILPDRFAHDADRLSRFQREAKVLASLNHPNIATIHGLEDSGSTHALVMELVEGPTLADRIHQGPIPVDEAVRIARQIADALEYAHEHGIVHRDLKPANVKVTGDDTVKILDFGLAKALEGDIASIDISTSPTISRLATQQGILLGTAAYMSPEQAKGKAVDRRADIWAFGCVLYEMLTGKMAFHGETVTDTLAAIIKEEPDWSKVPAGTPVRVRVLLQRCLQKDPKQRLRDIGDARISLDEILSGAADAQVAASAPSPAAQWRLRLTSAVAAVAVLVAVFLAWLYVRQTPAARSVVQFEVALPTNLTVSGGFALSPDGRKLAFIGRGADGQNRIWVRSLETLEVRQLDGTEGAGGIPFWSPDGRFLAFLAQAKLKKIDSAGGPPLTLCDCPSVNGGTWNRDDEIVFGSAVGLWKVSAAGGSASPLTTGGIADTPWFLPDGRHFLYTLLAPSGAGSTGIYLGSVDAGPKGLPLKNLLADFSSAVYVPSSNPSLGYLIFVRGAGASGSYGTLMAQSFDTRRLELTGDAVPITDQVANVNFSASDTNVLVYMQGSQPVTASGVRGIVQGQLTWFERDGKDLGAFGDPGSYRTVSLSPDGKRVAFDRADAANPATRNLWLYEFARGVTTRFTFDSGADFYPVWSPDGSRIAFTSNGGGPFVLYQKLSDLAGEAELLYKSVPEVRVPTPSSWSPDGRFLLYFDAIPPDRLWLLPVTGGDGDRKPIRASDSQFDEAVGRFSPDGRWIAYSSSESGKDQIYVRPFNASVAMGSSPSEAAAITGKWMVSKDGGTNAIWSHDGKELFYLSAMGGMMTAVPVSTSGVFQAGIPKALFKVPAGVLFYDVSADGKRFLMPAPSNANPAAQPPFTVVLNWQASLKK